MVPAVLWLLGARPSQPPDPASAHVTVLRLPASQGGIPDVFSAQFGAVVRRAVAASTRKTPPRRFVSEEGSRWTERNGPSILERFLDMPPDSPGRLRAERFLDEQGDPDGTLNEREKERFAELVAREYFRAWARSARTVAPQCRFLGGRFASPPPAAVLRGMDDGMRMQGPR